MPLLMIGIHSYKGRPLHSDASWKSHTLKERPGEHSWGHVTHTRESQLIKVRKQSSKHTHASDSASVGNYLHSTRVGLFLLLASHSTV